MNEEFLAFALDKFKSCMNGHSYKYRFFVKTEKRYRCKLCRSKHNQTYREANKEIIKLKSCTTYKKGNL